MVLKTKDYRANEIFRFLREGLDKTREELSNETGISVSSIEKYEYGIINFTYKMLYKVISTYNLNIILYNKNTKLNVTKLSCKDLLKEIRKYKNITQKELAQISGISISNITKYESNKTNYTFETLLKICKSCNLDIMISDTNK